MQSGRKSVAAVPCPHCGYAYSRAVGARNTPSGYRRQRKCESEKCQKGFITYECYSGGRGAKAIEPPCTVDDARYTGL